MAKTITAKTSGLKPAFKTTMILTLFLSIGAAIYIKMKLGSTTNKVDPSQFPLGKYPLAYQIVKSDFNQLMGNPKEGRKYNTFAMFNALDPSAGCQVCGAIDKSFKDIVSNFPVDEHLKHKVAFATLELNSARDVFQQLQIQTAPWLMFFKAFEPGQTPPAPVAYNIRKPMTPEAIVAFFNENLGTKIKMKTPQSQTQQALMLAGGLLAIGIVVLGVTGKLTSVLYSPWLAMLIIIALNSGYMFCRIRGIPISMFTYTSATGIAPGTQTQTGAEVWAIGGLSLINALSTVVLGAAVPKIQNPIGKRIASLIFVSVMMFGFNSQLQIFKQKLPSYPFKLFA